MEGKISGILAHRAGNYGGLDEILEAVLGRVDRGAQPASPSTRSTSVNRPRNMHAPLGRVDGSDPTPKSWTLIC